MAEAEFRYADYLPADDTMSMMPPRGVWRIERKLIHLSAEKGNSRKSAYSIVLRTSPQNPKARSLVHPHAMTDPYMLGLASIYGIVNAPLAHTLILTTQVLQPVLQPG